jgi:hypothetical protein
MHLVIELIIPKFIEGSTYFERHSAHHQELQTVLAASGLYTRDDQPLSRLDNGWSPRVYKPEAANTV